MSKTLTLAQQRKQQLLKFAKGRAPSNDIREEELQFRTIDGIMNLVVKKSNRIWYLPLSGLASSVDVTNVVNNISLPAGTVASKSANYTLTAGDDYIVANCSGGSMTIYTPASPTTGKKYTIKRIDGSANTVTVDANTTGGTTIDDSNTQVLSAQYDSISIFYDGSEWWIE